MNTLHANERLACGKDGDLVKMDIFRFSYWGRQAVFEQDPGMSALTLQLKGSQHPLRALETQCDRGTDSRIIALQILEGARQPLHRDVAQLCWAGPIKYADLPVGWDSFKTKTPPIGVHDCASRGPMRDCKLCSVHHAQKTTTTHHFGVGLVVKMNWVYPRVRAAREPEEKVASYLDFVHFPSSTVVCQRTLAE